MPHSFISVQIPVPTAIKSTTDENNRRRIMDKYKKLIQQKKTDLIAIHLAKFEKRYYQNRNRFDEQWSKMLQNHRDLVKDKGMPTTLRNLIDKRLKNITDKLRERYNYKMNYYVHSPYGYLEAMKNGKEKNSKRIGFAPSMIITTTHSLTDQRIQLLNRGPTYVPPCEMYISSSRFQSTRDIVKKQYAPLKHQVNNVLTNNKVDLNLIMTIESDMKNEFSNRFSLPLPTTVRERALHEMKLVQSIRTSLKNNNLILRRTADNQNTFYLEDKNDFEAKMDDFMEKTGIFKVLLTMDEENNEQYLHNELYEMYESMNFILETMHKKNAIDGDLFERLRVNASKVNLPYLYFLPDVSKVRNTPLTSHSFSEFIFFLRKVICLLYQLFHHIEVQHGEQPTI